MDLSKREYVSNGRMPSVQAFCLQHQKRVSRETLQMRIVSRNKYRIPNILHTLPPSILNEEIPAGDSESQTAEESTDERTEVMENVSRDTCLCSVCHYGRMCPPLTQCLKEIPTATHPVYQKTRPKKPVIVTQIRNINSRGDSIILEWEQIIEEVLQSCSLWKENEKNNSRFAADNRGFFWKCVCCGCCVHEQCLDFVDQWCIYQDANFHCLIYSLLSLLDFMCLRCLLADPLTNYPLVSQYGSNTDDSIAVSNRRACMDAGCCSLCGRSEGYLTRASNGSLVHKLCAQVLQGVSYNPVNSYLTTPSPLAPNTMPTRCTLEEGVSEELPHATLPQSLPMTRTHIEYILPTILPPLSIGTACSLCRTRKGRLVCCGYEGCNRAFHLSCMRPNLCICMPTEQGLFIRCIDHVPTTFRYDPVLNAIVPLQDLSIHTVVEEKVQLLRKQRDSWGRVMTRLIALTKEKEMRVLGMMKEVKRYYKRKVKYCTLRGDHILHCERSMFESWIMEEQGEGICKPVMTGLTEQLIKQNRERVVQSSPVPVVTPILNERIPESIQEKSMSKNLRSHRQVGVPSTTRPSLRSSGPVKMTLSSEALAAEVLENPTPVLEKPIPAPEISVSAPDVITVEIISDKTNKEAQKVTSTQNLGIIETASTSEPTQVLTPVISPPKPSKQVKKVVDDEDEWEDNWVSTESSSDFVPEALDTEDSNANEVEKKGIVSSKRQGKHSDKEFSLDEMDVSDEKETSKKTISKYTRHKLYELQARKAIRKREEQEKLRRQRAAEMRQAREERRLQLREEQIVLNLEQTMQAEASSEPGKDRRKETGNSQKKLVTPPVSSQKRTASHPAVSPEKRVKKRSLLEEARLAYLNGNTISRKTLPLTKQEEDAYWNSKYVQETRFVLRSDRKNRSPVACAVEIVIEVHYRSISSVMF